MKKTITIPDEIKDDVFSAFCYRQDKHDPKTETPEQFFEIKLLEYIKTVYEDYKLNIETISQVEQLKDGIKEDIQTNSGNIKIEK